MKKIELLAPASSYDGLKAVINAGADAVYLGGKKFGARAYAENFDEETLIEGIRYAHLHNVKVHLTVNTLVKEDELEELYNYILPYYKAGLDAVIVQDIGIIAFIGEHFPGLEIHMSTQTTITTSECKSIIDKYNITRIVLARELGLEEIMEIKSSTDVEVETFIHGALCYSYSGQCLLSSMIGDRSGNRGRCAQPCRKKYSLYSNGESVSEDSYLLSPKDMCGIKNIHNLINIGVDSLKIEGRMKNITYAATIVSIYRKYIDKFYELGCSNYIKYIKKHSLEINEDILKMQDVYNRGGFTSGYFDQHNSKEMMSTSLPSHQGVLVGTIIDVNKRNCTILFNKDVNGQDVLLLRDRYNFSKETSYEFTLKDGYSSGDTYIANYTKGLHLEKGYDVYRIKNNELLQDITDRFINIDKKIKICFNIELLKGKPCKVEVSCYNKRFIYEFDTVEEAINRPITKENVIKQFSKISDTCYDIEHMNVLMDDDVFVPLKILNDYRRKVVENISYDYNKSIMKERLEKPYKRSYSQNKNMILEESLHKEQNKLDKITVCVHNLNQLNAVMTYDKVKTICLEMEAFKKDDLERAISLIKMSNKKVYIALPRIIRNKDISLIIESYGGIFNKSISGYIVRNMEGINIIKKHLKLDSVDVIGDANLYTLNDYAKQSWTSLGIDKCTISTELSKDEIESLDINGMYMIIYGKIPVMVSANCVKKTVDMCNYRNENLTLKDNYGEEYTAKTICNYCYNVIYNSKPINIISDVLSEDVYDFYRVDFVDEDKEQVIEVLNSLDINNKEDHKYKGHFARKTL